MAEALRDAAQALSSTRNLDELLDRILQNARRIVPHDAGVILLIDDHGDAYMARMRDDTGRSTNEIVNAARFSVAETANLHVMAELRRPLVIADVNHYPGWIHLENEPWTRSYVGAPICIEEQVIGFIALRKVESDFFTREHAERLQALAQQAAIAIENARSFEVERRKSDMAEALRETAAALNSTLNLDEVFDRILTSAAQVVPYDAINIMLLDEPGVAAVVRSRGYEEFGIADWVRSLKMNVQETCGLLTHRPHAPALSRAGHPGRSGLGRLSRNELAAFLHRRADPCERARWSAFSTSTVPRPISSPPSRRGAPRPLPIRWRWPCRMRNPMKRFSATSVA